MTAHEPDPRLSRIKTRWTIVFQAHQGQGGEVTAAQRYLLLNYYRSAYRYLRAMLRDGEAARELTHEFAVRFLRGDFKRADPARGRFRDLLKQALRHLAIDHWRRLRLEKATAPLPEDGPAASAEAEWHRDAEAADQVFLRGWRHDLLTRVWRALARFQDQTQCPYYTVLRLRTKHPKKGSTDLAHLVGEALGHPLREPACRQLLRRAREKFADFLVAEVARSLATADPDAVEAELIELNLFACCRRSVARLRRSGSVGRGEPAGDGPPKKRKKKKGSEVILG